MKVNGKLALLGGLAGLVILAYLTIDVGGYWDYVLPRRGKKLLAMMVTGTAIAFSTVIFQTITHNRILTPSIIGLDSLYVFIQTAIVFVFGSLALTAMPNIAHFTLSVGLMVVFALLLYHLLFRGEGRNVYFLLLIGIVFGTFFNSIASFFQMLMDPNEYQVVQDSMFASLNNVRTDLLLIASLGMLLAFVYFWRYRKTLDVLSLGRDHAVDLGVHYDRVVKQLLIVVAVMISIAMALVGRITFLGLLVANIAYEYVRNYRHRYTIPAAILLSFIALIGGQLLVEHVFTFTTTLSVIINFIGGVYFIYLLLRERKV